MSAPSVEPWAVHTMRCLDAPCVFEALRAAVRGDDQEAPMVWGPDHWRYAVAIFPRAGVLPVMFGAAAI
eukprot:1136093-Lingulodinium_polyedra.AAC.1